MHTSSIRAEAMNALESAVYSYRDDLSQKLASFLSDSDKEMLGSMLTKMEDWLYDEGEELTSHFLALFRSRRVIIP